jgi:hypothetical protein
MNNQDGPADPTPREAAEDAGTVNRGDDAGSGFPFGETTFGGLERRLSRAMSRYRDNEAWRRLQRRAMQQDFGWERSGQRYLELFSALLGGCLQGLQNSGRNAIGDPILSAPARDAIQTRGCR